MPKRRMLHGHHLSVLEAQTVRDLHQQTLAFAHTLGFNTFTAFSVIDRSFEESEFYRVDNTPMEFLKTYNDERLCRIDPVMQHCKLKCIPIMWDQRTYVGHNLGEMWEHQASYGYKTGIALALHLPGGRHFSLGIDSDRPLNLDIRRLTSVVSELQLFAVHAQETAFRVLTPRALASIDRPQLTPRELEVLKRTMDGMSTVEIANALIISEKAAVFHIQNAMRKLNCNSKYQAVLKAIRLGFLS